MDIERLDHHIGTSQQENINRDTVLNELTEKTILLERTVDKIVSEVGQVRSNSIKSEDVINIKKKLTNIEHQVIQMQDDENTALRKSVSYKANKDDILEEQKQHKSLLSNGYVREKSRQTNNSSGKYKYERIDMYMDSNRMHIIPHKLWKNINIVPCGTLADLHAKINNIQRNKGKYVAMSVGVNDIDVRSGKEVFSKFKQIVEDIWCKSPHIKIIMNEITPRNADRGHEGTVCNDLLKQYSITHDKLFLATQRNMRNDEWSLYDDIKHISKHGTAKFASNMKRAFRQAFGIVTKHQNLDNDMLCNSKSKQNYNTRNAIINDYKKEMLNKLAELFQTG